MDSRTVLNRSRQAPAEETTAFGGIAERFRRAGQLDRAVVLCREGLQKFPDHLSARVTLGWALLDQGKYVEAQAELEQVLKRAPDNLAAIRGLAELHERAENAVELSLDGPGPWPPDADAIEAATPAATADAVAAQPVSHVADVPSAAAAPDVPMDAVARSIPAAPIVYEGTIGPSGPELSVSSSSAVEMKAFADLLADPIVEPVAAHPDVNPPPVADVSLDLGEAGAEALLKALDELEGVAPVEVAEAPAEVQSVEVPVLAGPAPDELVSALDREEPAASYVEPALVPVAPVAADVEAVPVPVDAEPAPAEPVAAYAESAVGPVDEIVVDLESIPLEFAAPELAGAAPVDTPDAAVEVQAEAEPEVSDGFILTGDSAAEAGVLGQHDPALAEAAERLVFVADTDTLSLDFEAPVEIEVAAPAPVPAGPPALPVRSQATSLVLERMLTRVKIRRVEVASEYHLAS